MGIKTSTWFHPHPFLFALFDRRDVFLLHDLCKDSLQPDRKSLTICHHAHFAVDHLPVKNANYGDSW